MALRFAKYEGLGNDFLVVDGEVPATLARRLCDRHLGVGADGVLSVVGRTMSVINADGSTPEMCGNGLRCVALHLTRQGVVNEGSEFHVDTDAGPHRCVVEGSTVSVDLPAPSLAPDDLPMLAEGPVIEKPFEVDGARLHGTAVSLGNPHIVFFDDVGESRLRLGPRIGTDARFPQGVNVSFARAAESGPIALHVFERGAGWTRACGTGACATAVAAVLTERRPRHGVTTVSLPGGNLDIIVGEPADSIRMVGPARHVFDGVVETERFNSQET